MIKIVRSLTGPTGPSNVAPVQPPPTGSQTCNVDQQIISDNLPKADHFFNVRQSTGILGALVYDVMMQHLVTNRKLHTGQEKLAKLFNVPKAALKRAITGNVRKGGKWYEKDRERVEKHLRQEAEDKDKQQREKVKLAAAEKLQDEASNVKIGFSCHICGVEFNFDSRKELDEHLNDHQRKTTYFTCHLCSQKFTDYNAYLQHQASHKKREFICCECRLVCESYKELDAHAKTHKFPC